MTSISVFSDKLMQMIARNELQLAIQELQALLKGSPAYSEVILHSSRYHDVMKSIRMGTISFGDSSIEKNKIRYAVIDMIRELEEGAENHPKLNAEVEAVLAQQEERIRNTSTITGDGNINVQGISGSTINLHTNRPSPENTNE